MIRYDSFIFLFSTLERIRAEFLTQVLPLVTRQTFELRRVVYASDNGGNDAGDYSCDHQRLLKYCGILK